MANEATVSQAELDKLFSDYGPNGKVHIWVIKCKAHHSIIGYRCFSYNQALNLLQVATKDYPQYPMEIVQIR